MKANNNDKWITCLSCCHMWIILSQNCHSRIWSFEYQDRCNFELKSSRVWVTTCGSLTRKSEQTAEATQLMTSTKPELHGSLWGNISIPFSAGMSKWVKRKTILPWMSCEPQSHPRQEAGSEEEQKQTYRLLLLSPQDREERCACSLSYLLLQKY